MVGEGDAVAEGFGDGVAGGVTTGSGFGFVTTTPLFQTSFFPLLTQVNFLPFTVAVLPAFLHGSPALTAAIALMGATRSDVTISAPRNFLT